MKSAFFINGIALIMLSVLMFIVFVVGFLIDKQDVYFIGSFLITLFFGVFFIKIGALTRPAGKEILFITTYNWIIISVFSSIPFVICGISISDALFESVSGITTTGATTLVNLQSYSKSILLWRVMLHFIGGIGIIIFAIAALPVFKDFYATKLLNTEFSDKSEKIAPHAWQIAIYVLVLYVCIILCCALTYYLCGMGLFDSFCHSISTVSTGGFTNYDESFAHYKEPLISRFAMIFMLASALPFTWYLRIIMKKKFIFDEQVFWFLLTISITSLVGVVNFAHFNAQSADYLSVSEKLLFSLISIATTTGFVNFDYDTLQLKFFSLAIFFLMFFGGCSGSTSGGFKFFRLIVLIKNIKKDLIKIINPMRVVVIKFNFSVISDCVLNSVFCLLVLNLLIFIISVLIIALFGFDCLTSMTSVSATLTNSGPGLGQIVGPSGTYATIPALAKFVLMFDMLAGRLEVVSVIIFFIVFAKRKAQDI